MFPDTTVWQMATVQFWQLTATIVMLGGLAALLARRHPHWAYALWLVVLVKAITPPIWSSNLGVFGLSREFAMPAASNPGVTQDKQMEQAMVGLPSSHAGPSQSVRHDIADRPVIDRPDLSSTMANWPAIIWLAGSISMFLLALVIMGVRRRSLRRHSSPADSSITGNVQKLARQLGIARHIHVAITEDNLGPALCGVWKPIILLPECLVNGKSFEDLRPILVHELIHLRRGDHLISAIQCLVHIVWWFHPLVWMMNRAITRCRERSCDLESVEALQCQPSQYARCLLNVLSAKANLRPMIGLPGVRPAEITMNRVKEIIAMNGQIFVKRSAWQIVTMLLAAIIVLPGYSFVPNTQAEESAAPASTEKASGPNRALLKYGDGKADGRKSIGGSGEMILFETPGETGRVRAVRVHGARYGYPQPPQEDIEITLLSEDMTEVLHTELVPYSLFKRVSKNRWTHLPFRDPVEVPKKFWVVLNFNAEQTKGVYVSYDTSTKGVYSRVGLSEEDARETDFGGDWMVQVLLAP